MPDYLEEMATRDRERHMRERESARSVIISTAPESDRQNFLDALGLLEP